MRCLKQHYDDNEYFRCERVIEFRKRLACERRQSAKTKPAVSRLHLWMEILFILKTVYQRKRRNADLPQIEGDPDQFNRATIWFSDIRGNYDSQLFVFGLMWHDRDKY